MALISTKKKGLSDRKDERPEKPNLSREELRDDLRQRVEATDGKHADGIQDEHFVNKKMYLAEIEPSPDNARTRHISRANPLQNKLPEDHPDYAENIATIKDIEAMAENLKVNPLLQPISVYRQGSRHIVSVGHVRYFGMLVAHGDKARIDAKVYGAPPADLAVRRFTENSARSDISLKAKFIDFKAAVEALKLPEISSRKVSDALGAGRSTVRPLFYALTKPVFEALILDGAIKHTRPLLLLNTVLSDDDLSNAALMSRLREFLFTPNAESKLKEFLESPSFRGEPKAPSQNSRGRPLRKVRLEVRDVGLARRLVTGELYAKYEWTDADFESLSAFQDKINQIFEALKKNNESSENER